VCTDLADGCPAPSRPPGDAPELYVGDPHQVPRPGVSSHPDCQNAGNEADCCACGGGTLPDSCPAGREVQLSIRRDVFSQRTPEELANLIGLVVEQVPAARAPTLLRTDLPTRARDRVRIFENSIETPLVEWLVDGSPEQVPVLIVRFYFAAWHPWFPSSLDLAAALFLELPPTMRLRSPGLSPELPPLLRVAPPDPMRPYPNSIAYAEYQAGAQVRTVPASFLLFSLFSLFSLCSLSLFSLFSLFSLLFSLFSLLFFLFSLSLLSLFSLSSLSSLSLLSLFSLSSFFSLLAHTHAVDNKFLQEEKRIICPDRLGLDARGSARRK
jgi:hypothetical protein